MKMMKQTQTIFGKVKSTRLYLGAKQVWKEQTGLFLGAALVGGYSVKFCKSLYERRVYCSKVDRMREDYIKRVETRSESLRATLKENRKASSRTIYDLDLAV